MDVKIKRYEKSDVAAAIKIWNDIVCDGVAFPQTELLNETTGNEFFTAQSYTGIAFDADTRYILGIIRINCSHRTNCRTVAAPIALF